MSKCLTLIRRLPFQHFFLEVTKNWINSKISFNKEKCLSSGIGMPPER